MAVWQAEQVKDYLDAHNWRNELTFIKSEGDINLVTPLYELGVQGIFTKSLDIALLENRIDIAVHSHKDVPTQLAKGLQIAAVLKRGNPLDVLVCREELRITNYELRNRESTIVNREFDDSANLELNFDFQSSGLTSHGSPFTIATSSIRRKAQWAYKYPNSNFENLRGNVITRIQKVKTSDWHGAIFAAAGLERLGLTEKETGPQIILDWMLPAPAQGAVVIVCREKDAKMLEICAGLNDANTQTCTKIERDFLRILQGGCSTPIAAFAKVVDDEIIFKGSVTAVDGSECVVTDVKEKIEKASLLAQKAADEIINKGGKKLLVE